MEIKTKYNIGDEVYIMHKDKPSKRKITGVNVKTWITEIRKEIELQVIYNIKIVGEALSAYTIEVDEGKVYNTKEELFNALEQLL